MTREEIMKLEGDTLNRAVAERVMNWQDVRWEHDMKTGRSYLVGRQPTEKRRDVVWHYHEDIDAAMAVVTEMLLRGYSFALWDVPAHSSFSPGAAFHRGASPPSRFGESDSQTFMAQEPGGDLATLICRAALLAVCEEKAA